MSATLTDQPTPAADRNRSTGAVLPPARRRKRRFPWLFMTLLVVSVVLMLPFATLITKALTPLSELSLDRWFPTTWQWHNFIDATTVIPFWRYAKNSTVIAVAYSALTALTSALVGYGFARFEAPGKRVLFGVLVAMMIVPQIVTLIPTYLLFSQFGLVGTYWPWVLWGMSSAPYAVFLFRQFYSGFPKELDEAARLDGASRLQVFLRIFLPLSKPMLVTAFVLAFNASWGDFVAPNLLLNQDNTTLAVGISGGYHTDHGVVLPNLLAAGSTLYVLPVVLIFLLVQRSYVNGFVSSGLK